MLLKNSGGVLPLASSRPVDRGHRRGRLVQTADRRRRQRRGQHQLHRHPAAGHHRAACTGVTPQLLRRLLRQLAAALAAVVQRGRRLRQRRRVRGQRPDAASTCPAPDNSLISAVAAANPHTIVVLNTGSAVTMPWLYSVTGRPRGLVPGPAGRQRDRRAAVRRRQPVREAAGDLPDRRWPRCPAQHRRAVAGHRTARCSTPRASTSATAGTTRKDLTPLFPFGYGLSYTTLRLRHLQVGAAAERRRGHGHRDRDQHRLAGPAPTSRSSTSADPAATGEPPRQLKGFARVEPAAGRQPDVRFPLTQRNLSYWNTVASAWATAPAATPSRSATPSRNLPLTGTLRGDVVSARPAGHHHQPWARRKASPGRRYRCRCPRSTPPAASRSRYSATGLPAGISISGRGTITGTPSAAGTSHCLPSPRTYGTGAFGLLCRSPGP